MSMDNKDIFELLENAEDSVIDELDSLCEPLDKASDKRIFALSRRKSIRSSSDMNGEYEDAEGVERIMKRPWKSTLATVAAAVVICGGTVGTFAVLSRHSKPEPTVSEAETSDVQTSVNTAELTEAAAVTSGTAEDKAAAAKKPRTEKLSGTSQNEPQVTTAADETGSSAVTSASAADKPAISTAAKTTAGGKITTTEPTVTTAAKTTSQQPKTTDTVTVITTDTDSPTVHRLNIGTYVVDVRGGQVYKWFESYRDKPEETIISACPTIHFTYEDGYIYMRDSLTNTKKKVIDEWATLPYAAYFADLNADGYPELCMSVNAGSGVSVDYAAAYDIRNDKLYKLEEWLECDYKFSYENGKLYLLRKQRGESLDLALWEDADKCEPVIDGDHGLILREVNGISTAVDWTERIPMDIVERAGKADFNGDGVVDPEDAQIVLDYITQKEGSTADPELEKLYDINNDGIVLPMDASYILFYHGLQNAAE